MALLFLIRQPSSIYLQFALQAKSHKWSYFLNMETNYQLCFSQTLIGFRQESDGLRHSVSRLFSVRMGKFYFPVYLNCFCDPGVLAKAFHANHPLAHSPPFILNRFEHSWKGESWTVRPRLNKFQHVWVGVRTLYSEFQVEHIRKCPERSRSQDRIQRLLPLNNQKHTTEYVSFPQLR